jgi:hypothetical protein
MPACSFESVGKLIAFSCAVVSNTSSLCLARSLRREHPAETRIHRKKKKVRIERPQLDHAFVGEVVGLFKQQSLHPADRQHTMAGFPVNKSSTIYSYNTKI